MLSYVQFPSSPQSTLKKQLTVCRYIHDSPQTGKSEDKFLFKSGKFKNWTQSPPPSGKRLQIEAESNVTVGDKSSRRSSSLYQSWSAAVPVYVDQSSPDFLFFSAHIALFMSFELPSTRGDAFASFHWLFQLKHRTVHLKCCGCLKKVHFQKVNNLNFWCGLTKCFHWTSPGDCAGDYLWQVECLSLWHQRSCIFSHLGYNISFENKFQNPASPTLTCNTQLNRTWAHL